MATRKRRGGREALSAGHDGETPRTGVGRARERPFAEPRSAALGRSEHALALFDVERSGVCGGSRRGGSTIVVVGAERIVVALNLILASGVPVGRSARAGKRGTVFVFGYPQNCGARYRP
jgi:hypothetical protein